MVRPGRYEYHDDEKKIDYCRMIESLFNQPSNQYLKNSLNWVLRYINEFNGDKEKWNTFNAKANVWKWWDILKTNDTDSFEAEICQMDLADCSSIPPTLSKCNLGLHSRPYGAIEAFDNYLRVLWGLQTYVTIVTRPKFLSR